MYAMRTTRADWAGEVCAEYDALVKETAESLLGVALPNLAWKQACLSTSAGGLGLRSSRDHAPAAYIASATSTRLLCTEIDPNFSWETHTGGLASSTNLFNSSVAAGDRVDLSTMAADSSLAQTELSTRLEAAQIEGLYLQGDVRDRARLRAASAPHAGAWLSSPATRALGLHLTSSEFAVAALLRLGGDVLGRDVWCPRCDQTLTRKCDHGARCRGGGDITTRHNGLRDDCFFRCLSAGLDAEREMSGLLPTDPRRRPADVFLLMCPGRGPLALDFAVTCPLRHDMVHDSANRTLAAAMDYEAHKNEDRATAQRCSDLGFTLVPMIAETLGGWGPAAQGVFKIIAKSSAEVLGLDESTAVAQLYQGLGIRLQRSNARAILSRISAASAASHSNTALAATSRSEAALVLSAVADISG